MKISVLSDRQSLAAVVFSLSLVGAAHGGSLSTDFSSGLPPGTAVYGDAGWVSTGGAGDNTGALQLTPGAGSKTGSFIIEDLDSGARIGSFLVTFNLHMGNGTTPPADGISFNFATDLPNAAFNEEGAGTGLTIVFDAFDNSTDNNSEGPEFRIKFGGNTITRRKISTQFQTGAGYVPVVISYTSAGALTLVYNNIVVYTNMFLFSPMAGGTRFGFSGRTGGSYQEQFIDDLNITTSGIGSNGFYIKGQVTPYPPVGISGASSFLVQFQDNGAVADPNSVAMFFNGEAVTPTVSKPAGITTIGYTPHGALLPNSVNHMAINFSLSGTPTTLLYDFPVTNAPLWSLAPLSRPYLPLDTDGASGTTPLYRSVGFNPLTQTNHLYVVSRTGPTSGLTVNVLDATTGADLYQMNTTGIAGSSLILINIVVGEDGVIYAASVTGNATTLLFNVYRWANDSPSTAPTVVFSGDPGTGVLTGRRWGDGLAVRGTGLNTQLILDCNNTSIGAILAPTNTTWVTNFTSTAFNHTYPNNTTGASIGRSLQFGPTNTFFLKKRSNVTSGGVSALPLELIQTNGDSTTTLLLSVPAFYGEIGPVTVDLSRNLAAGIMIITNAGFPDHLVVYDISNLASPLEIAQYDFPVTHRPNNNWIGQVVIAQDKIFAVDGNNGIIAVPIAPSMPPVLKIAQAGSSAVLSWTNTVPGFVLQSTTSIGAPSWSTVAQPVSENGMINSVTDTPTSPTFYRLLK